MRMRSLSISRPILACAAPVAAPALAALSYHRGLPVSEFQGAAMKTVGEIDALLPEMKTWRHHIHAHPETAFEESGTAAFVADKLRSFGLDVHTGLAKTGVVGVLRSGSGKGAIGLRADLD